MEQTLVLIKPDAVMNHHIGAVITRFEKRGLKITDMRMLTINKKMAALHYAEHVEKAFYPELENFITSGPVVAMVVEGEAAISAVRQMAGATDPMKAQPGTIRADFALSVTRNVLHSSDSSQSAVREIAVFFGVNF